MDVKLREEVEARLRRKESPTKIREALIQQGFSEQDVEGALKKFANHYLASRDARDRHNNRILALKELVDRIGYGAAAPQFLNILFFQTGASLFLLGFINGLRSVFSLLLSGVAQEYAKVHLISKKVIGAAGILFGFSFLFMAFAIRAHLVWLYALSFLFATIGVVTHGDLYQKLVSETLKREKMSAFLQKVGQYGILITLVSMLASGWLIDAFPEGSFTAYHLFGLTVRPIGYLLSFEVTAFAFIISGYVLSLLRAEREARTYKFRRFLVEHYATLRTHLRRFLQNKYILLLVIATAVTGLLEVLGQSYYGLFLWQAFGKRYLIVALLYGAAIPASLFGPWLTKRLQKKIGLSPMLVFGTLLIAILPFTLIVNHNFFAVGAALILSVIGGAILGLAQGLLARKLMDEEMRKKYFTSLGLLLAVPYLFLTPVGAWFAQRYGLEALFLIIGLGLLLVVAPLYFILVALAEKERL